MHSPTKPDCDVPAVSVRSLTKRYGDHTAVDDLTFDIQQGSIVGFLGPNGAGKTTTFRMLMGLAAPTTGTAHVFGADYRHLDDPLSTVGAMLEMSGYHPTRTARQHLRMQAMSGRIGWDRVDELIELVGIGHAADRSVGGYSSGMRQRLGLAGALLGDPDLLLLDEPANGLDPEGIHWLRDFLRLLSTDHGKTVLVSSHVLAEVARTVDDVVIIRNGCFVTQGPIDQIETSATHLVIVRTPDVDQLIEQLIRHGASRVDNDGQQVSIEGMTVEAVGKIAFDHRILLNGLWTERSSLEDAFLALTSTPIPTATEGAESR